MDSIDAQMVHVRSALCRGGNGSKWLLRSAKAGGMKKPQRLALGHTLLKFQKLRVMYVKTPKKCYQTLERSDIDLLKSSLT